MKKDMSGLDVIDELLIESMRIYDSIKEEERGKRERLTSEIAELAAQYELSKATSVIVARTNSVHRQLGALAFSSRLLAVMHTLISSMEKEQ